MTNDEPAFPVSWVETSEYGDSVSYVYQGMSRRDWFAGQALAGLCANPNSSGHNYEALAYMALCAADATLAARSKKGGGADDK